MSSVMESVYKLVSQAAEADAPVLLRGESGTGKGQLARLLHAGSARKAGPFVVVDCRSLLPDVITNELFGHGASGGRGRSGPGQVETAAGGTLLFDEVGEIPFASQAKILRFIQEGLFERVGDPRSRRADVRIVATTSQDLEAHIRGGRFREDLFYGLNVIEIRVPTLRERREDVIPLARELLVSLARRDGLEVPTLSAAAEQALARHDWPGNVRELRIAIERALILSPAPVIDVASFPTLLAERPG